MTRLLPRSMIVLSALTLSLAASACGTGVSTGTCPGSEASTGTMTATIDGSAFEACITTGSKGASRPRQNHAGQPVFGIGPVNRRLQAFAHGKPDGIDRLIIHLHEQNRARASHIHCHLGSTFCLRQSR